MITIDLEVKNSKQSFNVGDVVKDSDGTFLICVGNGSYLLLRLEDYTVVFGGYDSMEQLIKCNKELRKINEIKFKV